MHDDTDTNDDSDTNAAIWKSTERVAHWMATASDRDRQRRAHWSTLDSLLPFAEDERFEFLDLGAGTGAATQVILEQHREATAVLADFSPEMIARGHQQLEAHVGRFHYVEFDMRAGKWPAELDGPFDAVVTSLCIHHMPDDRKRGLFSEILERLAPGSWYLNYDPVRTDDPVVAEMWRATAARRGEDSEPSQMDLDRDPAARARHENHVRYMIPLDPQVEFLRQAGFEGVDVFWKDLENVIYGGRRAY